MVKKIGKTIVAFILLLAVAASPVCTAIVNCEPISGDGQSYRQDAADGFELMAENEALKLYLNAKTLGIQVYDKKNGVFYNSFVDNTEGLNESWQNFMCSGVTLEYMTDQMKLIRIPFSSSGAKADIVPAESGFEASVTYNEGFAFIIKVSIYGNRLSVQVPDDSIQEPEDGKQLQSLYIYPSLGATCGLDVPGYLFVPDGCGALIRTDVKNAALSGSYNKRVYGQELGVGDFNVLTEKSPLKPAEIIYMPVYGIIQEEGKAGIAAVIEEGDVYAAIEANIAGRELSVSYETAKFIYRETYTRSLNLSGTTMVANQPKRNHMDIVEHYYFLSEEFADYSGIAKTYQKFLVEQGVFTEKEESYDEGIPFLLEIFLSEQKKRLIGTKTVTMTTQDQADAMITELRDEGINDMSVIFLGYSQKGTGNAYPSSASFTNKIASKSEWSSFIEKWKKNKVDIGFYVDFSRGSINGSGYSKRRDIAQNLNEKILETYGFYFLAPEYVQEKFEKETETFMKLGTELIAVDAVGYQLYSNWNSNRATSRKEAQDIYESLSADGLKTGYYKAASYLWKNAEAIYDIPSTSSNYMVFTETVPFMQLVLKGYVDYYSDKSNFHADTKKDTLRMIEYGEFPSWVLTAEDSIDLLDTPSSWLYTSKYDIWKNRIIEEYRMISDALGDVRNARIVRHEKISEDVACVTYDNGKVITVNYSDKDYYDGNVKIEALSYMVSDQR